MSFLGGDYMKMSARGEFGVLVEGFKLRGQRFIDFKNHSKVLLMSNGKDFYSVEGSSNWTGNPRLEQYVLTNCKSVYDFHRSWMEHYFKS